MKRATALLAAAAFAVASLIALTAAPVSAAPVSLGIRGTIACPAGKAVVGVWVQSSGGGSKYAAWTRYPGASTMARFSTTISTNLNTNVYLNVGCGGSTATWGSSNRTPTVTAKKTGIHFYNAECPAVNSCRTYPMENNTPAAPGGNVFPAGQCTFRGANFWKDITGRFPNWRGSDGRYGHAYQWDERAKATGWTVGSWPRPDSLVVWQQNQVGGGFGHVGYVADVRVANGRLELKIYDQNWDNRGGLRQGVWQPFKSGMGFIIAPPRVGPSR